MTHQTQSIDITSKINTYTRALITFWTTVIILFIWFDIFHAHNENRDLAQKIETVYTQNNLTLPNNMDLYLHIPQFVQHERNEIFIYAFSLCILWGIGLFGILWGSKKISRQILEHEHIQNELLESERRFHTILNHASDALYISDLQGRIIDCNQSTCSSLGYTHQEMLSLNVLDIDTTIKDRDELSTFWNTLKISSTVDLSSIHKRKDNTTYPVELRITKIPYQDDMVILGLARDVTEQKRIEKTLEEQREKAIQTDRLHALGEMSAGVAHELNQPLAAISAISEGLCLRIESGMVISNQKLVDEMTDVLMLIDRMGDIIDHMRVFSRDTINDPPITFKISAIIDNTLKLMRAQIESHGIQIDLYVAENLPECKGWPNQMEEVILNILINARDALDQKNEYHNKNGSSWQPQISINAKTLDNRLQIDISDNGNGIPDDIMAKIFNPFFTTKEVGKGTGLGLSISKSIVEKHGGMLNVYNHPNKGVTFSISVPFAKSNIKDEHHPILNYTS